MLAPIIFFWGTSTKIMFPGWRGRSFSFYMLALICVFHISLLVEWLWHARLIKSTTNHVSAGLLQTLMYAIRIALAYVAMLAFMSFNIGVFLAAVAGYSVGSQVFRKFKSEPSDLPSLI